MGAAQSKTTSVTSIVNEAATNALLESASSCKSSSGANQTLTFSDIKTKGCSVDFRNISQGAEIKSNLSCAQDSAQNAEIFNKFATNLDQTLDATLSGIPSAFISNAETNTMTNLRNTIKNNINMSQLAECVSQSLYNQKMEFGKIEMDCTGMKDGRLTFDNISQKLIATQVANCLQSNQQAAKAAQELENIIVNKQSSANTGINPMVLGAASSASSLIPCLLIIGFVVVSNIGGSE
jgi:hypothetical protein